MNKNEWFGRIYEKYRQKMFIYLLHKGYSEEKADDMIHYTCVYLLQRDDITERGFTSLFQKTIKLNSISRKERDPFDRRVKVDYDQVVYYTENNPETDLMRKQDTQGLFRIISKFPRVQKRQMLNKLDGENAGKMTLAFARARRMFNPQLPRISENLVYLNIMSKKEYNSINED